MEIGRWRARWYYRVDASTSSSYPTSSNSANSDDLSIDTAIPTLDREQSRSVGQLLS